ncbi:hypothetical protein PENSPDRAFT_228756 [Peniophora sp. CONT]|nr:hypothetical protein PENSPDRAFT_228756 [Peniophora sp. CONT]
MAQANNTHDTDFYFNDELYVIQVKGTLFRVHQKFLTEHSRRFADMFAIPRPEDGAGCGLSDSNPIILDDVETQDFKSFLEAIYHSARPNFVMPAAGWLRVLCVAHRYDSPGMHARALDGMRAFRFQPGQDTEALACAEQHDIDVRLVDEALKYAITRQDAITAEELASLSTRLASKLCAAREKWAVDNALRGNSPDFGSDIATQGKPCDKCKAKYHAAPNIQKAIASIWGKKERAEDLAGMVIFSAP